MRIAIDLDALARELIRFPALSSCLISVCISAVTGSKLTQAQGSRMMSPIDDLPKPYSVD